MRVRISFHHGGNYDLTIYEGEVTDEASGRNVLLAACDLFAQENSQLSLWDDVTVDFSATAAVTPGSEVD